MRMSPISDGRNVAGGEREGARGPSSARDREQQEHCTTCPLSLSKKISSMPRLEIEPQGETRLLLLEIFMILKIGNGVVCFRPIHTEGRSRHRKRLLGIETALFTASDSDSYRGAFSS